jgi:hypothetical protein
MQPKLPQMLEENRHPQKLASRVLLRTPFHNKASIYLLFLTNLKDSLNAPVNVVSERHVIREVEGEQKGPSDGKQQ